MFDFSNLRADVADDGFDYSPVVRVNLAGAVNQNKAVIGCKSASDVHVHNVPFRNGNPEPKVNDFNLPRMDIQSVFAIIRSVANGRDNVSFAIHTGRAFRFVHGQEIRVFYSNLYVSQNVHLFLRLVDGIENMLSDSCFTLQFTCPLRAYIRSMVVCRSIGWVWCNVC